MVIGNQNEQIVLVKIEDRLPVAENLHAGALRYYHSHLKTQDFIPIDSVLISTDCLTQKTSVHLGNNIKLMAVCILRGLSQKQYTVRMSGKIRVGIATL